MSIVADQMITTAFELPGRRVARNIGVVRGIVVRSRSVVGNLGAALQTLVGGNITIYTELCEQARREAYDDMRNLLALDPPTPLFNSASAGSSDPHRR